MRSSILLVGTLALTACGIGSSGVYNPPPDAPPPLDAYHCDPAQVSTPPSGGPTSGDTELGSAHRAGQDCMACHGTGVEGAPVFTIAGTLYVDPNGTAPVAGATIFMHDATGAEIRLPTAENGNFYYQGTVQLPLMGTQLNGVKATECPNTKTMQETSLGGCNAQGCHADPNTGSNNIQGRVYL